MAKPRLSCAPESAAEGPEDCGLQFAPAPTLHAPQAVVMAAKPIERFIKKQIADQGGWPRILERIASGETVADVARTLLKPDGQAISRNFLSTLLHADPERSASVYKARDEGSDAMVDQGLHLVDSAQADRDSINKAKVQAEMRLKVAGFVNRERWGEAKQAVNVSVNVASLHVDALRHRIVEASRPLAAELAAVADYAGVADLGSVPRTGDGSPADSVGSVSRACETVSTHSQPRDRALQKDAEWLQETASQQVAPSSDAG